MAAIKIQGLSEQQTTALEGIAYGDMVFIQKFDRPAAYDSDSEDEGDSEGDDESDEGEGSGDNEDDEENEDDGENQGEGEDESAEEGGGEGDWATQDSGADSTALDGPTASNTTTAPVPPRMYVVSGLTKDSSDDITGLQLSLLTYSSKVTPGDHHSYHVYGKTTTHHHPATCGKAGSDCSTAVSLADIITDENFLIHVKPNGDSVRMLDAAIYSTNGTRHGQCIAGCKRGFLSDASILQNMIKDYDPPTYSAGEIPSSFQKVVCPCCVGSDLLQAQQQLQAATMIGIPPELNDILDYQTLLNQRRAELGFSFKQFDERQWGYYFDDMLSDEEGHDGGAANDNGQWQQWAEANDPNANIQIRPASAEAIAALPRMYMSDVKAEQPDFDTTCNIGTEDLADDSSMIKLECGHIHCEDCLVQWLKQFNSCPTCRHAVPEA